MATKFDSTWTEADEAEHNLYKSGAFGYSCMNMYAKGCNQKHTTQVEAIACCVTHNETDFAEGYGRSWSWYYLDRNGYI
jgi:hypothetical protein